jgi:hypothetical protein
MISEVGTSRKPAQIVWASIWVDEIGCARKSDLVIMDCDFNTPKHGHSSQSYLEALRKDLLPYWRCTQLFMQDNARIHTSRVVQQFLTDYYINVTVQKGQPCVPSRIQGIYTVLHTPV